MAQVVYTNTNGIGTANGSLFNGMKFWLSARVPMRGRFIEDIRANGGQSVQLETQADMIIVDPLRKDIPADSFSYKFIDLSIRNGVLEDPEDHRAAPNALPSRPAGSTTRSPRTTRTPYTAEDDRFLLDWMKIHVSNGTYAGNAVFQQLEQKNARHTWQSWRDRYVKRYRTMPSSDIQVSINPPPTPPAEPADMNVAAGNEVPQSRETHDVLSIGQNRTQGRVSETRSVRAKWSRTGEARTGGDRINRQLQSSQRVKSLGYGGVSAQSRTAEHRAKTPDRIPQLGPRHTPSSALSMEPPVGTLGKVEQPEHSQIVSEAHIDDDSEIQHQQASLVSEEETKLSVAHKVWSEIVERSKFDLPNKEAVANLCSTYDSVLKTDDSRIAEAWEVFAEHYEGRSAKVWEAFWKDEIQPFYRKHLAEFNRRFATTYTSPSPEPTSPPPEAINKSPEFQPDSPELPSAREAIGRVPFAEIQQVPEKSPSILPVLDTPRSPLKRPQIDVEEEWNAIPDSLPLMAGTRISPKRRRIETPPDKSASEDPEIVTISEEESSPEHPGPLYPSLPPDSDDERQESGTKMRASYHDDLVDEDVDDDLNDNDDDDEFKEIRDALHVQEVEYPNLPAEGLTRSKLDTQGQVDAQLFADLELRTSVSRAGEEEDDSDDDESTIHVKQEAAGLAQPPAAYSDEQKSDMTDVEEDDEESDEEVPLEVRGPSPELPEEDEQESDQEPTPKVRGISPEIPETQTQNPPSQPKRVFRPAAFRNEDSPPNSPQLFVHSPTPPPPSSPPQLTTSPPREDLSDDAHTIPASSNSAASSTAPEHDTTTRELDDWFDARIAHGFSALRIQRALMSTSGDPDLADKVLEQMQTKNRDVVSGTMEGVWTEADDECLESDNPKMLGVVMAKHGAESVDRRYAFLRDARGEGSEE